MVPLPSPSVATFTLNSEARYPAPAMPIPLSATAAMTPATAVPWPTWSVVEALELGARLARTLAARSGWERSMPVSTTATVTAGSLRECRQAWGTSASAPGADWVPGGWVVFESFSRPHWNGKSGSLGIRHAGLLAQLAWAVRMGAAPAVESGRANAAASATRAMRAVMGVAPEPPSARREAPAFSRPESRRDIPGLP